MNSPSGLYFREAGAHRFYIVRTFGAQVNIRGAYIGMVVNCLVHFQILKLSVQHYIAGMFPTIQGVIGT